MDKPERHWSPVLTIGPYALLGVLVACTVIVKHASPGSLLVDLVLCAAVAAWMLVLFTVRPAWRERPGLMAVFLAGLIGLLAVLVVRDPWFGCFAPALYVFTFQLLRWPWRLPGVAAVAIVAGTAQAADLDKTSPGGLIAFAAVLVVNILPMSIFTWILWRNQNRDEERERALHEVTEGNRRLELSLAENAALHRQLLAQAREAGMLDERQRMAREIHDTLAQGLTGIITQLQAAEHASEEPDAWRRHFAAATSLARESLSEARRSVHALRPEQLETRRLSEAVEEVAQRWSALNGPAVEVTTTGTAHPLRPESEVALLRAAQEALANVAKHAEASRVGVTLSYLEDEVALDVRDDGRGFDPGRQGGGFGLVAMRERIEALSGTLQVETEPGGGTGLSARVPAHPAEATP
ncbi:sensor histidine kinase [Amycolatopsis acidicola]|uniref:Oxygen sensor histidine kinase NreB n=1 Tax=Amycolatopsis acidicola TaxID=2596893 RepID=A0A5N0VIW8_9PSEU|nr:sensor histidine kinase [Amycolatopsis acidicola]KAA9165578.1 sensor histidine kinase [Amycolatopsis acidicola]